LVLLVWVEGGRDKGREEGVDGGGVYGYEEGLGES